MTRSVDRWGVVVLLEWCGFGVYRREQEQHQRARAVQKQKRPSLQLAHDGHGGRKERGRKTEKAHRGEGRLRTCWEDVDGEVDDDTTVHVDEMRCALQTYVDDGDLGAPADGSS